MKGGKFTGKKSKALATVRKAFDEVAEKEEKNPLQLLVDAVENAAPREEVTRLQFGGISVPRAVDASPARRLNVAIRNIALGRHPGLPQVHQADPHLPRRRDPPRREGRPDVASPSGARKRSSASRSRRARSGRRAPTMTHIRAELAKAIPDMMRNIDQIRNIGIVAHIHHGKTTLSRQPARRGRDDLERARGQAALPQLRRAGAGAPAHHQQRGRHDRPRVRGPELPDQPHRHARATSTSAGTSRARCGRSTARSWWSARSKA